MFAVMEFGLLSVESPESGAGETELHENY